MQEKHERVLGRDYGEREGATHITRDTRFSLFSLFGRASFMKEKRRLSIARFHWKTLLKLN